MHLGGVDHSTNNALSASCAFPQLDTGTLELRDLTLDAAYLNALLVCSARVCSTSAESD